MRLHRRVRRLPRRLSRNDPRGGLRTYSARVSVRLARHPGRGRAITRRADLRAPRARLRAAQPALAGDHAACTSSAGPTRTSPSGRTSASGRSCSPARPRGLDAAPRARPREGRPACAASSSSRCGTGACISPATPRTSSRRPARRASTSRSPTCAILAEALASWHETGSLRCSTPTPRLPAPRLAGRALLLVDDVDAAPLARGRCVRGQAPALAAAQRRLLARGRDVLAENYVGLERV